MSLTKRSLNPGDRDESTPASYYCHALRLGSARRIPAGPAVARRQLVRRHSRPGDECGHSRGPLGDRLGGAAGGKKIAPGDTVWLSAGTYPAAPRVGGTGYEVRLAGGDGAPISIRAVPGARVTIDGGLNILPPATWIEIRDLEILVSEPRPAEPIPARPLLRQCEPPLGRVERQRRHGLQVHQPGHPRQQPGRELVEGSRPTASSMDA